MQELELGAVLGILEDTEADIDEAEPKAVRPKEPEQELALIPLPKLKLGVRPNLGTLNQEFLLPVSCRF